MAVDKLQTGNCKQIVAAEGSGAGGSEYPGATPCTMLVLLWRSTLASSGVDAPPEPRFKSLLQPLVNSDMSDTSHTRVGGFVFNVNSLVDQPKELMKRTDAVGSDAVKYKLTRKGRDVAQVFHAWQRAIDEARLAASLRPPLWAWQPAYQPNDLGYDDQQRALVPRPGLLPAAQPLPPCGAQLVCLLPDAREPPAETRMQFELCAHGAEWMPRSELKVGDFLFLLKERGAPLPLMQRKVLPLVLERKSINTGGGAHSSNHKSDLQASIELIAHPAGDCVDWVLTVVHGMLWGFWSRSVQNQFASLRFFPDIKESLASSIPSFAPYNAMPILTEYFHLFILLVREFPSVVER